MGSSSESSTSNDGPSGSDNGGGAREANENTSRGGGGADSGSAANPSAGASFDNAMDNAARPDRAPAATPDKPENDNRPGGPEGGDTTPGYSGPTPDPRGPALDDKPDDKPDDEQNEDDKPATTPSPTPGGLPDSDTTPDYTGPVNDPRGPALGGGDNGNTTPAPTTPTTPETEDPNAPSNAVGDFFGGLVQDARDFSRENPRVDSHGNPVGLVDANGIQHGEVASGAMASGRTSDQLARDLGFSSPQDMATAQNTGFIADEYQKDLTRRAVMEVLNPRNGLPPEFINALGPPLNQPRPPTAAIPAGFQAIPPDMIIDSIMKAAELMPDISPEDWAKTAEVMKNMSAGAVDGAIQGFAFGATTGALPAGVVAMADGPLPGPADIAAGISCGIYTGATTVAGAIAGGGAAAIEGLVSLNENEGAKPSDSIAIDGKIQDQAEPRGWTEEDIKDTVDSPEATSKAKNKQTGNDATAYFDKDGSYVVVDDKTGDVVQVSDRNDPGWVPDNTIEDPYEPEQK